MLHILDKLPSGMLKRDAAELHEVLPGPTLIHLPGRRPEPLFVSVLLHGNEDTGWQAMRALLDEYRGRELPRAVSLFIGNVQAARHRVRMLEGQPDFNRIWEDLPGNEHLAERGMTRQVVQIMRECGAFASIDIHNNTGINPHYACVRRLDQRFFRLATLFSRTVVYFRKPDGVQPEPFSQFCPAVTVECGQPGQAHGVEHALEYIRTCLNLTEISEHPVAPHDINLFHTVAIVKVPADLSIGVDGDEADIRLVRDLDHLNFRELPTNTTLGWIRRGSNARLEVWDESGHDVAEWFLRIENDEIRTRMPVMPSMFTVNLRAIREDCLGYLMENSQDLYHAAVAGRRDG